MLGFFQVEEGLNRLGSQSVVLLILANEDSLRVAERRCLGRKTRPRAICHHEAGVQQGLCNGSVMIVLSPNRIVHRTQPVFMIQIQEQRARKEARQLVHRVEVPFRHDLSAVQQSVASRPLDQQLVHAPPTPPDRLRPLRVVVVSDPLLHHVLVVAIATASHAVVVVGGLSALSRPLRLRRLCAPSQDICSGYRPSLLDTDRTCASMRSTTARYFRLPDSSASSLRLSPSCLVHLSSRLIVPNSASEIRSFGVLPRLVFRWM